MKRLILAGLMFFFISPLIYAGDLQAYLSYSIFNTPDNQPFIETYLVINGKTVKHIQLEDGTYQGIIDVKIMFRRNDSIVNFGKYELLSPRIQDTNQVASNLLDVQRYSLPPGDYQLEFEINDRYGEQDTIPSFDTFSVQFDNDKMKFSDIELLHDYFQTEEDGVLVKNGYRLVPLVFDYLPELVNNLKFYAEVYNSNSVVGDDQYLLYYYIRPFEIDKKLDQFFYTKRLSGENINVLLNSIDISNLPSGNYYLVLEARDRNNNLLCSTKKYFQRYNPNAQFDMARLMVSDPNNTFAGKISSRDTLVQYIDYLYPISTEIEKDFAKSYIKTATVDELQKYFLNFWTVRNPTNPESEWQSYKLRVDQANSEFKSIRVKGYRTDRGRVYLKYGRPNVITPSYNEPAAYPYEIWHYYELQGQRDKKFVFYTRDIATNDFQLIHSNAMGELQNYRWQTIVYGRTWDPYSVDDYVVPNTYGGFATDYYTQPR